MSKPKGYRKVAHRWDQYTKAEVTVWLNPKAGGDFNEEPRFILEVNEKMFPPISLGELQSLQDCLRNDLDLNKPSNLGIF